MAENDYFDARMAPHQDLIDAIYGEIEGRQPAELTTAWSVRGWPTCWQSRPMRGCGPGRKRPLQVERTGWRRRFYQWRYGEGSQYREWLRWLVRVASDENAREGPSENAAVFLDEPIPG